MACEDVTVAKAVCLQHKQQLGEKGFQLIDGATLDCCGLKPPSIRPRRMAFSRPALCEHHWFFIQCLILAISPHLSVCCWHTLLSLIHQLCTVLTNICTQSHAGHDTAGHVKQIVMKNRMLQHQVTAEKGGGQGSRGNRSESCGEYAL